jgi:hypothetical protein
LMEIPDQYKAIRALGLLDTIQSDSGIEWRLFVCVCVCVRVMYSGENDDCDVTLSVHPHWASWKECPTTVGIESATFGILVKCSANRASKVAGSIPTSPRFPKVAGSITAVVRQTYQLARCACTRGVISQTSQWRMFQIYSYRFVSIRNKLSFHLTAIPIRGKHGSC